MKFRPILSGVAIAALDGCTHDTLGGRNYVGSPGSTYDPASNPPQAHGDATNNANSPIVPHDYGNGGDGAANR